MTKKMKVARLACVVKPLEIGEADVPVCGPTDVLVKVAACGLVPNFYNIVSGKTKHLMPELPAVMGLDVTGTIAAVGEHVVGLQVGQRVYVDPYLTCGTCEACRSGATRLCAYGTLRGYFSNTPLGQPLLKRYPIGGLSEYVLSPDTHIVKLPDNIDLITAARFGYSGTSFGALRRGNMGPGKTLLINGITGTLGVAAAVFALGMGATKILGVGRKQEVMDRVKELAPSRVETMSLDDCDDLAAWVLDQTSGKGVDVMYDCLGAGAESSATEKLIRAVKPGGKAVLVGGSVSGSVTQTYIETYSNISVLGSMWFDSADIDTMVAMIGAGVVSLSHIENKIFRLDDVNEAVEFVGKRPGGFINVVVTP